MTHIDIAIGNGFGGLPATLYVWSDPDGDGDPTDATVIASAAIELVEGMNDLNENTLFNVPEVFIGPNGTSFFVGC